MHAFKLIESKVQRNLPTNMPRPHPLACPCRRPRFRSSGLLQSQSVQSGAPTRWAGSCVL